jgi:hypothetical protein
MILINERKDCQITEAEYETLKDLAMKRDWK